MQESIRKSSKQEAKPQAIPAPLPLTVMETMLISREAELRENILYRQGRGQFQLPSAGHEALAGLAPLIRPEDYLYCYYRDRALLLAKGVPLSEMALSFFGKEESSSSGRQMASHFSYRPLNVMSCATPTAMQCLPAAGTAWGIKKEGKTEVVFCSIGDASTRQGEFFEALAFAIQEKLPVVFLVHDNGYGISTPTEDMTPLSLGMIPENVLHVIEGYCPDHIYQSCAPLIKTVRTAGGPKVLWIKLDRLMSHTSSDDQSKYRSPGELALITARDPLKLYGQKLQNQGMSSEELDRLGEQARMSVKRIYDEAEQAKNPSPESILSHRFSSYISDKRIRPPKRPDNRWTISDAFNYTLGSVLSENPKALLFGEDIADPKGGVFGLTRGLSTKYPERVINAPLAEATIAGLASGLAEKGFLPIFELQFIDFVGPAFNQIVNQIATLRWRSVGDYKCPLVLYAPCGSYISGGGPWHSQTNESWFAHAPGLKVYMPSNANDASAMLYSAAHGEDPVIMLLPKNQFQKSAPVESTLPLHMEKAAIRKKGEHLTIVSWGNGVEIALNAASDLKKRGLSTEVIDLRTIVPCDWAAIHKSVRKTGRLIVIQEDNKTCSFGQAIISEISSDKATWEALYTPPQLLSRADVHIGFHAALEQATLPHAGAIIETTERILGVNSRA